jgi:hypothetical protein
LRLLRFQRQEYPKALDTMFAQLALHDPEGLTEDDHA